MKRIRVAAVEDHPKHRACYELLLGKAADCTLIGSFAAAEEALVELPRLKPSVVLMDINLPGISGIECVSKLSPLLPKTDFLMLTVLEDVESIYAALSAGASGYLLKKDVVRGLVPAIRELANGGGPMSSEIARKVLHSFRPLSAASASESSLTPRETEILSWLAKGLSYKEVAEKANCAMGTLRTHIPRIYKKLHVHSRAEAVHQLKAGRRAKP